MSKSLTLFTIRTPYKFRKFAKRLAYKQSSTPWGRIRRKNRNWERKEFMRKELCDAAADDDHEGTYL